jgi:putative ABC transport system permease protein
MNQILESVFIALSAIWANKLRSFFTLLGIIVSVAFLVAVVAIIQGMNAYVRENIAGAVVGANAFQVRRTPLQLAPISDGEMDRIRRRPRITLRDAEAVAAAIPEARAISVQSGWPTPQADVIWRDNTLGDVPIFGITPSYQEVQDYRIGAGRPLTDVDLLQRQPVIVVGADIADKLFENVEAVGRDVRILGERFTIVGVIQPKGRVLGQSFDSFVLMPLPRFEMLYGRRNTTTISVKMAEEVDVAPAMA